MNKPKVSRKQLLLVLRCLIDTAERTTDLDGAFNDKTVRYVFHGDYSDPKPECVTDSEWVSWEEIDQLYKDIEEQSWSKGSNESP